MQVLSSRHWFITAALVALSFAAAFAQRTGGKPGNVPTTPPPTMPDSTNLPRPLYVSGSVVLDGGMTPSEPIAIERVCNGVARREGYTDFKGQFQIQLGSTATQFQDVTENPSSQTEGTLNQKLNQSNQSRYEGCEL